MYINSSFASWTRSKNSFHSARDSLLTVDSNRGLCEGEEMRASFFGILCFLSILNLGRLGIRDPFKDRRAGSFE
jgi:hypothetical protein